MLAGVTDCRRSWKWSCRGRLVLGFKPRPSSHVGLLGTMQLQGAPFLPHGLGSRRDFAWKKRGERTLAGSP